MLKVFLIGYKEKWMTSFGDITLNYPWLVYTELIQLEIIHTNNGPKFLGKIKWKMKDHMRISQIRKKLEPKNFKSWSIIND